MKRLFLLFLTLTSFLSAGTLIEYDFNQPEEKTCIFQEDVFMSMGCFNIGAVIALSIICFAFAPCLKVLWSLIWGYIDESEPEKVGYYPFINDGKWDTGVGYDRCPVLVWAFLVAAISFLAWPIILILLLGYSTIRVARWTRRVQKSVKALSEVAHKHEGQEIIKIEPQNIKW